VGPRMLALMLPAVGALVAVAAATGPAEPAAGLRMTNPRDGALFPRDIAAPTFRWEGGSEAGRWRIVIDAGDGAEAVIASVGERRWRPEVEQWEAVKRGSVERDAVVTVSADPGDGSEPVGGVATMSFRTSVDPVGAPIFYRDVPLPVRRALENLKTIRWRLGDVSSPDPPPTVLTRMGSCANCHSFSADGRTLAMDLDFGGDKGSYVIADVAREISLDRAQRISWSALSNEGDPPTFGLLAQISPDGRHAVGTVRETVVYHLLADPWFSQLFFPIEGVLGHYDRDADRFTTLPGADDPAFVQTNPSWSPQGDSLVFARAEALHFDPEPRRYAVAWARLKHDFETRKRRFRYDLYEVAFNGGRGGEARPIQGASANGRSNFFARFSPDGRWIVFCQADDFMLNQPDSDLYIIPAEGGTPRRLGCSTPDRMDSWHAFSPNGRWLVFASKAAGAYTQLWLTHIDEQGRDSTPVVLDWFTAPDRAANIPEFVAIPPGGIRRIRP